MLTLAVYKSFWFMSNSLMIVQYVKLWIQLACLQEIQKGRCPHVKNNTPVRVCFYNPMCTACDVHAKMMDLHSAGRPRLTVSGRQHCSM